MRDSNGNLMGGDFSRESNRAHLLGIRRTGRGLQPLTPREARAEQWALRGRAGT